jgi:hypothetical protein
MKIDVKHTAVSPLLCSMRFAQIFAPSLRHLLLVFGLLTLSQYVDAQGPWDIGTTLSTTHFTGDIGNGSSTRRGFIMDLQVPETRTAQGVFARRRLGGSGWSLRADFTRLTISGDDALTENAPRRARNLHFRNQMTELAMRGEFAIHHIPDLLQRGFYTPSLTLTGHVGVAVLWHNPEAQVIRGNRLYSTLIENELTTPDAWHALAPMQTEGVAYATTVAVIPVGASATMTISQRRNQPSWRIGLEVCWRFTFTDYLDDIHHTYGDPSEMSTLGEALSSQVDLDLLTFLGDEAGGLGSHSYVDPDLNGGMTVIRGNPQNNDSYGTISLSLSRVLTRSSNYGRSIRRSKQRRKTSRRARF